MADDKEVDKQKQNLNISASTVSGDQKLVDQSLPPVDKDKSKNIVTELNVPAETIKDEPKTADLSTPSAIVVDQDKDKIVPPAAPPVPPAVVADIVKDYTVALVSTLDVVNTKICQVIARQSDYDGSFTPAENDKLIAIWSPVVRKYYDKIPIEIIAGFGTVMVLTPHFIEARQARGEKSDDKNKDNKK